MKRKATKVDTSGGDGLGQHNPFASLALGGLPQQKPAPVDQAAEKSKAKPIGGSRRLEIRRLKAGKGGKTVTEVSGFDNCGASEVGRWHKQLKNRCASGGSLKGKAMEIQGDHRESAAGFFKELGFRPVMAGG